MIWDYSFSDKLVSVPNYSHALTIKHVLLYEC